MNQNSVVRLRVTGDGGLSLWGCRHAVIGEEGISFWFTERFTEKFTEDCGHHGGGSACDYCTQLSKVCGIGTRAVQKNIDLLREQGLLRRVGADKGGHWDVLEKRESNEG